MQKYSEKCTSAQLILFDQFQINLKIYILIWNNILDGKKNFIKIRFWWDWERRGRNNVTREKRMKLKIKMYHV